MSTSDPANSTSPTDGKLQANALGLLSAAALTAAYMGPALSIYALFGLMTPKVGPGVGLVMAIATGLTLLSAVSFGMLAKEMPAAGGVYAWTRVTFGKSTGLWVGLCTVMYFAICQIFPPIIFGNYFNETLSQLGVATNNWTWLLGAMILLVTGAWVTYRGIAVSAHLALALLLIELAVVLALTATFFYQSYQSHTLSWAPVTFEGCTNGWKGIFLVLPMALLCVICDAATPAGEETENARWTIPIAVLLPCVFVGGWYVIGFSAFSLAFTTQGISASELENGIAPMAERVWGSGKILVSLTAMSAALGAFIPGMTAASRVLFAIAREGQLPRVLARLHPTHQSPWNALHVLYGFTLVAVIPTVMIWDRQGGKTIEWWSFAEGWFVGVVYLAVNLVNIFYYWRFVRPRFHPVLNLIVPTLAIVVQLIFIWRSVIIEPWDNGLLGRSTQAFLAVASAAGLSYVFYVRRRTANNSTAS